MKQLTVQDLLEAGCHFGHQTKRWNPRMKPYVYGAKNGISIIDITKTIRQIGDAANFLQHNVMNGGKILFVGTKRQAQQIVKEAAVGTGMHFVCERWLGGTLTNNQTIRKSINKMLEIDKITDPANAAAGASLKKKEIVTQGKLGAKLHRDLDGIVDMKRLPDVIFIVDVCHDEIAVKEAKKLGIPTVAIVDTNGDPSAIDYPIAANDDAVKSIKVIIDTLVEAIKDASELYSKKSVEDRSKIEAARAAKDEKHEEKRGRNDRNAKGDRRGAPKRKPAGQGQGHGGHRAPRAAATEGEASAAAAAAKPAKKKTAPKAAASEGAAAAPKAE